MTQKLTSYFKTVIDQNKCYLIAVLTLNTAFYLSTTLITYQSLKKFLPILDSYIIDQLLFLIIAILIALYGFKRKILTLTKTDIFFVLFFVSFTIYALFPTLGRYFISDDIFVMFTALTDTVGLDYSYSNKDSFFYYHFLPFCIFFKFFKFNAFYYNLFSVTTIGLASFTIFKLLTFINNIKSLKDYLIPVLFAISFVVSPSIMESFFYVEHSMSTGFIVIGVLTSAYFYTKFLNTKKAYYFILNYAIILFLLRTSLTRTGFWPICLILLEFLYLPKRWDERINMILRILSLFLPFYLIAQPYFSTNGSGRLYGINATKIINIEPFYLFFSNIIPAILPYQFWAPLFKQIRADLLINSYSGIKSFILHNLLFTSGVLFVFVSILTTIIFYIKKIKLNLFIFFLISSFISLFFYMSLGNVSMGHNFYNYDMSILNYHSTPGSRYYQIPTALLIIILYLVITKLILTAKSRKNFLYFIILFSISFSSVSSLTFTRTLHESVSNGVKPIQFVSEEVVKMVPDDGKVKVLYSTNGYDKQGLEYFFKPSTTIFITDQKDLIKYLKANKIKASNFYAFYFIDQNLEFTDMSIETRKKFANYLINE